MRFVFRDHGRVHTVVVELLHKRLTPKNYPNRSSDQVYRSFFSKEGKDVKKTSPNRKNQCDCCETFRQINRNFRLKVVKFGHLRKVIFETDKQNRSFVKKRKMKSKNSIGGISSINVVCQKSQSDERSSRRVSRVVQSMSL